MKTSVKIYQYSIY